MIEICFLDGTKEEIFQTDGKELLDIIKLAEPISAKWLNTNIDELAEALLKAALQEAGTRHEDQAVKPLV